MTTIAFISGAFTAACFYGAVKCEYKPVVKVLNYGYILGGIATAMITCA